MGWAVLESCSKVPVWPGLAVWIALFGNVDGRALAEARFSRCFRLHGHGRALTSNDGGLARSQSERCVAARRRRWCQEDGGMSEGARAPGGEGRLVIADGGVCARSRNLGRELGPSHAVLGGSRE